MRTNAAYKRSMEIAYKRWRWFESASTSESQTRDAFISIEERIALRAGMQLHRFIGIWDVMVEGRVFVR